MKKPAVILAAVVAAVLVAVAARSVWRTSAPGDAARAEAAALRACGDERRRTPAGERPRSCLRQLDAFVAACTKVRPQRECLGDAQRLMNAD